VENLMPKGLSGTPRRTLIVGIAALVLAVVLLLVYLRHYRNSVRSSNAQAVVLVSKAFIPKGTTAFALAKGGLYEQRPIPKDQLLDGAISDSAVIQGEVALGDIYPDHQLTTADFGVTPTSSSLSGSQALLGTGPQRGTWRALSLNLDASHGIVPQAQTDDTVDVYAEEGGAITLLLRDVLVLAAPNQSATNTTSPTSATYILRVPTKMVGNFTYLADNGRLWFALRPQKGAKPAPPVHVTGSNATVGAAR
jgi:hypothetical protein